MYELKIKSATFERNIFGFFYFIHNIDSIIKLSLMHFNNSIDILLVFWYGHKLNSVQSGSRTFLSCQNHCICVNLTFCLCECFLSSRTFKFLFHWIYFECFFGFCPFLHHMIVFFSCLIQVCWFLVWLLVCVCVFFIYLFIFVQIVIWNQIYDELFAWLSKSFFFFFHFAV